MKLKYKVFFLERLYFLLSYLPRRKPPRVPEKYEAVMHYQYKQMLK